MREIAARGHEIACHGYGHEIVYESRLPSHPRAGGPQPVAGEAASVEAAAGLPREDRTGRGQLDGQPRQDERRGRQQQAEGGSGDVEAALEQESR